MSRLVFIGPPGAGKGTQAQKLVNERGLLHISTGDLLRKAIKDETPLGLRAKNAVDAGELVPDGVVIGLVEEMLANESGEPRFILDGFPRTIEQAVALDGLLVEKKLPIEHVILFDIAAEFLQERIAKRAKQSRAEGATSRSDDNPDVLKRRVEEFVRITAALVPFYEQRGLVRRVDARRNVDEVATEIAQAIDGFRSSPLTV